MSEVIALVTDLVWRAEKAGCVVVTLSDIRRILTALLGR